MAPGLFFGFWFVGVNHPLKQLRLRIRGNQPLGYRPEERGGKQGHPRMLESLQLTIGGSPCHNLQQGMGCLHIEQSPDHELPRDIIPNQSPREIGTFRKAVGRNIEKNPPSPQPPVQGLIPGKTGPDTPDKPLPGSGQHLATGTEDTALDFKGGTHGEWRKGWDSNPRWELPHVRFRVECLKPSSATLPKTGFQE